MNESVLNILNMVSEGKITAQEGAEMIEAAGADSSYYSGPSGRQENSGHSGEPVRSPGTEIHEKFKDICKEIEPQFMKIALSALETAAEVSGSIHHALREFIFSAEQKAEKEQMK